MPLLTLRCLLAAALIVICPSLSCPVQLITARGLISRFHRHVYTEMRSSHYTWLRVVSVTAEPSGQGTGAAKEFCGLHAVETFSKGALTFMSKFARDQAAKA
jgi:hypothetical protein